MDRIKRVLSLVLCFVMVFGLMPMNIFAVESAPIDAAIFCSDVHGSTSDVTSVFGGIKENGVSYSTVTFVGDTFTDSASAKSTVTSAAQSALDSTADCLYTWGDHDYRSDIEDVTGLIYGDETTNYYVYAISMSAMTDMGDSNTVVASTYSQELLDAFTAAVESMDKTKPLFIASHMPLHSRRGDNDYANNWYQVISAAAEKMDIVFFWAHNHTSESDVDRNAYYVAKDGTETMTIEGGSTVIPNFTYMNAGYINAANQNPSRKGVATSVAIYDDVMVFQDYSSAGEYTDATYSHNVEVAREFAAVEETPTVNTVSDTEETTQDTVTAVGLGLTGVTLTQSENADTSAFQSGCVAYDVALEGYIEGETVTLTFDIGYMDSTDLVVYADGEQISPVSVENVIAEDDFASVLVTVRTTSAAGTYIIGKLAAAEDAVLTGIEVTAMPTTTNYTLVMDEADDGNIYLDITGLVITATYDNGQTIPVEWDQFDDNKDGYALEFDISVAGTRTVKVTYGGFETSFDVTVYEHNAVDADVSKAVADVLKEGYIAKEFAPTGYAEGTEIRVIMPAPEGANVVYHVADDNTLTKIEGVTFHGGYVIFDTDHFSTYVVGQSTEIEVPDPETATGSGSTTTTTKKTVYVLTSSISSGNEYLIVNGNAAGSYYALANNSGSVAATGVTVKSGDVDGDGDNETYIELDDAADELWTVGGSYTFQNGNYYLGYTGNNNNRQFGLGTTARTWSYGNNRLSIKPGNTTYYLRYNSGWTWTSSNSASGRSIYFYIPTEIEVETTTTVSGTYSIAGEDLTKVVVEGTTAELKSTRTFTPTSGSATTEDVSTTATYEVVTLDKNGNTVNGDPNGIIEKIANGVVTFTGNYGEALVKVSYTTDFGVVTDYIIVTATEPTYVLDITKDGTVVTGTTVPVKGVTATTTLQLGTKIQFVDEDGAETVELPEGATVEWHIPEEYHKIATVNLDTGLITFKGVDGAFYVTATLTVGGKDYTVGVNISATTTSYSTPTDGPADFPEYPNEGAIRFDKTGTAVGNFSETGIAQIELSMTGVPYTTGSEMDVVIMLDQSTSMGDDRIAATVAATKAFIKSIVINEDGSYNGNRVYVGYFNGSNTYDITDSANIGDDLASIDNETELNALFADIDDEFDGSPSTSGTEYGVALEKCYNRLNTAKTDGTGNDRQQFCVFMSDGVPTTYQYTSTAMHGTSGNTQDGYSDMKGMFTGTNYDTRSTSYKYEYYSTQMKANGVTVYTVGLGLEATNNAWNGASATQCLNAASLLLNDISGPGGETTQPDALGTNTLSKKDNYFFSVEDADAASQMTNVFQTIAQKIMQAATDVTVEDQITDEYTMIFDIPEGSKDITGVTNDFYIEFGKYALDEDHERDTYTSVTKLYLENTDSTLSAKDTTDPVFEQKPIGDKGTLYYWSTNADDGDTDISITVDETTYYFVSYGLEEAGYNMTSGAYANGTVDSATNMSEDLVIATPYFVYNAETRMIYWTVDKLDTYEYTLSYFLYLNNSATEVATENETDPGSYPTNDHAYITYTNFNGNDCRQEFPIPQLTWSGAQVSYVFYLVNAQGQPINKSGQIVDFANATFVTDVYTENTVWNKGEDGKITADSQLGIEWLAEELLPADYKVYDENAEYKLHVYGNHDGTSNFDYFIIGGSDANTISSSLNSRLEGVNTTASNVSLTTTKVYNTKAGQKITGYGTYTSESTSSINDEIVLDNFDFYNTTVAFAVVWQPTLVPDVVVVDYGLDVIINVVQNDILQNAVSGIGLGNSAYGDIAMNTGVSTTSELGTAALTIDGNTISIENETSVRFHQGDMEFDEKVVFYYETPVEFWEGSDPTEGYMYSSVTVIPATTIYYEDDFVTYSSHIWSDVTESWTKSETNNLWSFDDALNSTQDQDRPGASLISGAIDADNVYGYDGAYTSMSTYSNGSAAKATVDYEHGAQAQFTFWGTGFDIISLTSNQTGTILVDVEKEENGSWSKFDSYAVDTYYGYTQAVCHVTYTYRNVGTEEAPEMKWVRTGVLHPETECPDECKTSEQLPENPSVDQVVYLSENAWIPCKTENSIYQVPVIKMVDKPYARYRVTIMAIYDHFFDHLKNDSSYDFYLDAIRIYDPANDGAGDQVIEDAYKADHEGWPSYIELRNKLIATGNFADMASQEGMVFIDGDPQTNDPQMQDYVSYGPNNEVYLDVGQSVAFQVDAPDVLDRIHIGIKSAMGTDVTYTIKNVDADANVTNEKSFTLSTSTDMYYDMTEWKNGIVVITNSGSSGILSITNIKSTYTSNPAESGNAQSNGVSETRIYMTAKAANVVVNALKPAPVNPFADVQKEHFFYESVLWAVENGITNGVSADCFAPFMYCNRAQVVTFLWRAAGSPEPTGNVNPFTDVKESDFFYKAVLWAVENGITNGMTATTFGPNALCNRAQVVTFLWRANGSVAVGAENPFADVPADAFYYDAVVWAVKNGITTGTSATAFDPNGTCMRAHVVTFLYRAEQLREYEVFGWNSES